jgi:hypothetical protein
VAAVVVPRWQRSRRSGAAARQGGPVNTSRRRSAGRLRREDAHGDRGEWSNSPTDYTAYWLRCEQNGGSCATSAAARPQIQADARRDVGNTIRFRIAGDERERQTDATSVPTARDHEGDRRRRRLRTAARRREPEQVAQMSLPRS